LIPFPAEFLSHDRPRRLVVSNFDLAAHRAEIASSAHAQSFFPFAVLRYPTESSLLSCPAAITEIMRAMSAEQA